MPVDITSEAPMFAFHSSLRPPAVCPTPAECALAASTLLISQEQIQSLAQTSEERLSLTAQDTMELTPANIVPADTISAEELV